LVTNKSFNRYFESASLAGSDHLRRISEKRYRLIVVSHCTGRSSRSRDALAPAAAGRGRPHTGRQAVRSPIITGRGSRAG
jgi:hypothetical protein